MRIIEGKYLYCSIDDMKDTIKGILQKSLMIETDIQNGAVSEAIYLVQNSLPRNVQMGKKAL